MVMANNLESYVINKTFLSELMTGILSSPIIIIPHFHYSYVDKALILLIKQCCHNGSEGSVKLNHILEIDESRGIIDFETKKRRESTTFQAILEDLLDQTNEYETTYRKIILCKGGLKQILEKQETVADLVHYSCLYERGVFDKKESIIFVDDIPMSTIPRTLVPYTQILQIPMPNEDEILKVLYRFPISSSVINEERQNFLLSLVRVFQGLHQQQIFSILRSALIRTGGFLSVVTKDIAEKEKKNLLKKSDTIEIIDSDVNLEQVGGLDVLKEDIKTKAKIFKNISVATSNRVNLPYPKGILILGMPGCGKSMIAKAIANEFKMPLLRLDINRMMGKYVGESEANLRQALQIAEAAHPCVLWIDEIEKAFSGSSNGDGGSDSVVVRLMGYFLTWMQERKSPVYIVATANDVMRPEFMRKGRFDEVYFVDFPNKVETTEILHKKISRYENGIFDFSLFSNSTYSKIAELMQCGQYGGFSGSEIEAVVTIVMEKAFVGSLDLPMGYVTIKITDFEEVINVMKKSIMANQKGRDGIKTNIEKIREVQNIYGMKKATK